MQHDKGAIDDDIKIITKDVEKWWETIKEWYWEAVKKRSSNRDQAVEQLEEGIKKVIMTVKKVAAREVNEARDECRVHEHEHPLYHQVQRLVSNLSEAKDFVRDYKNELKKYVDLKEFEKIRDRIEGDFDLLHEIQRLRDDLRWAVQEISRKANAKAYDAPLDDEKDPQNPV